MQHLAAFLFIWPRQICPSHLKSESRYPDGKLDISALLLTGCFPSLKQLRSLKECMCDRANAVSRSKACVYVCVWKWVNMACTVKYFEINVTVVLSEWPVSLEGFLFSCFLKHAVSSLETYCPVSTYLWDHSCRCETALKNDQHYKYKFLKQKAHVSLHTFECQQVSRPEMVNTLYANIIIRTNKHWQI